MEYTKLSRNAHTCIDCLGTQAKQKEWKLPVTPGLGQSAVGLCQCRLVLGRQFKETESLNMTPNFSLVKLVEG